MSIPGSFLGIDLGTSGLRLLLVDADGAVLGSAEAAYDTARPHPGWSEQDPAVWTGALSAAVDQMRDLPGFAGLQGIGISGHMHGATMLGEGGAVLRPCILWNDMRAADQARAMDANPAWRKISGNIVFPGFTAPKLAWVARHEPEVFAQIHKVLLPAAYLAHWLTGAFTADLSDSAGTSWLDVAKGEWSEALLEAGGMRADQMPGLAHGCDPVGVLKPELAAAWGVGPDVTVAAGAGDNAAAACGIGALGEGQGFVSLGTSGVVLVARDRCAPDPATAVHTFNHAVPGRWYQMSVMLSATDCLNWWARITGESPADLTGALGEQLHAPSDITFRPYLGGERTPHNSADLRAGFDGIGHGTDRAEMTRAILQGVCFGLRDGLEALRATGADPKRLFLIGGGARSGHWAQMAATVLGLPLDLPAEGDFGAALGAARLGQIAATGAALEDVIVPPPVARTVEPVADLRAAYEAAYERWRR